MPKKPLLLTLALALLIPAAPAPAHPGEAAKAIEATMEKARAVLLDPRLRLEENRLERRELLRRTLAERFDWDRFCRGVLGVHGRGLSDEQKQAFEVLFRELLEATYLSRLDKMLDQVDADTLDSIRCVEEETDGNRGFVRAEIDVAKRGLVSMVYSVNRRGDQWMIYDVKVAGISMVKNYREQIDAILTRSSYEELMERLREKVAAFQAAE